MSYTLPQLSNDKIYKTTVSSFAGYDHELGARDGAIYDMQNLCSDYYPLASPRKPRYLQRTITKPNGLYAYGSLYWVDGTKFYKDGEEKGAGLTDSAKIMVAINTRVLIFPDKKYYQNVNGVETFGSLESSFSGTNISFQNGTYAEEDALANTIYKENVSWDDYFSVGDAVTIEGCTIHTENNKTPIIREIGKKNETDTENNCLRFYEDVFTLDEDEEGIPVDYTEEGSITIKRTVPDLDYVCENDNRVWGCNNEENSIYCCKLGDPFNWNVFDSLSTDSYAVSVGSPGNFTGCISYLGYPIFFKEDHIYKMYGDYPSNYQLIASATLGVMEGASKSLAIANEVLYYMSKVGIMRYSGGVPQNISTPFGTDRYSSAVAGSNGNKYYVSMKNADGLYSIFVYDALRGMWHKEDDTQVLDFAYTDELYMLDSEGQLWLDGNAITLSGTSEGTINSILEFADFVTATASSTSKNSQSHKGTSKIQIRAEIDEGSTLTVQIKFDSDGIWHDVASITSHTKKSYYLPIIPRRSDHYKIRLLGTGDWKLYDLTRENYVGSDIF